MKLYFALLVYQGRELSTSSLSGYQQVYFIPLSFALYW